MVAVEVRWRVELELTGDTKVVEVLDNNVGVSVSIVLLKLYPVGTGESVAVEVT